MALGNGRRRFLGRGIASLLAFLGPRREAAASTLLKPPRLKPGDTVGLVNPVSVPLTRQDADAVCAALERVGLHVVCRSRFDTAVDDQDRDVHGGYGTERVVTATALRVRNSLASDLPPRSRGGSGVGRTKHVGERRVAGHAGGEAG